MKYYEMYGSHIVYVRNLNYSHFPACLTIKNSLFVFYLGCFGTEASLLDCPYDGWRHTDCSHSEDVAVVCDTNVASGCNLFICKNMIIKIIQIKLEI